MINNEVTKTTPNLFFSYFTILIYNNIWIAKVTIKMMMMRLQFLIQKNVTLHP
jgi:hypothetical protein